MGKRRKFTAGEKVAILRAHLLDQVAVSELCEKHGLQPTQFYQWQKQFFENGDAVFERRPGQDSGARPGIISDNGPQFLARDFKEFIRLSGMTHVKTSPYYPQSNGKIEPSALGYIAPADKLAGRAGAIWAARGRKLEAARAERRGRRETARREAADDVDRGLSASV